MAPQGWLFRSCHVNRAGLPLRINWVVNGWCTLCPPDPLCSLFTTAVELEEKAGDDCGPVKMSTLPACSPWPFLKKQLGEENGEGAVLEMCIFKTCWADVVAEIGGIPSPWVRPACLWLTFNQEANVRNFLIGLRLAQCQPCSMFAFRLPQVPV